MTSPAAALPSPDFLAALAPSSAAAWHALAVRAFPGELSLATQDTVYRFVSGALRGRAEKAARGFESSREMRALRLIGFLHDEGGFWSITPAWREGAHALLWRPDAGADAASVTVTAATLSFTLEERRGPEPKPDPRPFEPTPSPWTTRAPQSESQIRVRRVLRPPTSRQPLPASMTRIHCSVDAIGN